MKAAPFSQKPLLEIRGAAYLWECLKKAASGVQFSIFASDPMPGY